MKKNIYIIVGEGRCGKSSLVRALTGVFRRSIRGTLQLVNGEIINIAIWPRSAQEGTSETPEQVLRKINGTGPNNVLIVLRPWGAQEYIDLLATQHNIIQVLLISSNMTLPGVNIPEGINVNPITNSRSRPVNANAAVVRTWWGWM